MYSLVFQCSPMVPPWFYYVFHCFPMCSYAYLWLWSVFCFCIFMRACRFNVKENFSRGWLLQSVPPDSSTLGATRPKNWIGVPTVAMSFARHSDDYRLAAACERAGEHAGCQGGIHGGFPYGFQMVFPWLSYVFNWLPMVFPFALPMVFFLCSFVLFAVCKCIPIVAQGLHVMCFIFL